MISPDWQSLPFLSDVIDHLPEDRVSFSNGAIRVIGDSGKVYRIEPHDIEEWIVMQELENEVVRLSIEHREDILNVPLADILANLVLALFHDGESGVEE